MAKSSKLTDLMSIIAQATPAATTMPEAPRESPKTVPRLSRRSAGEGGVKKPKAVKEISPSRPAVTGKFSSIYLNPEDQKILRKFSAWFAGQGRKINDTLIIRAALRAAKTGGEFLAAYDEATLADRRFKKK